MLSSGTFTPRAASFIVSAIALMCFSVTPFIEGASRSRIAERSVRNPWKLATIATHAMPHSGASLCRIIGTRLPSIRCSWRDAPHRSLETALQREHRLEHPLPHLALLLQDVGVDEHSRPQRQLLAARNDVLRIQPNVDAIDRLPDHHGSDL